MLPNITTIENELEWLKNVLHARLTHYFQQSQGAIDPLLIAPPMLSNIDTPYASFVNKHNLDTPTRLILILALAPLIKPPLLDILFKKNDLFDKPYSEFGGIEINGQTGFLPTIQTAFFLLSGDDLSKRLEVEQLFTPEQFLIKKGILDFSPHQGLPLVALPLRVHSETCALLFTGKPTPAITSTDFPAIPLHTRLDWEDLVLPPDTLEQLTELRAWLDHGDTLMQQWELSRHLKPGYRCLFCGPPGTGKTLTATLLGKVANRLVYRIDLSRLVSKYIGETEKNLEKVFNRAAEKNWILFFDEADALFGNRTQVTHANDRYANQETAYLLQKIETCPNVVILASNLKNNIDEAFMRRFQSIVEFPIPTHKERLRLWQQAFGKAAQHTKEESIDFESIAKKYEIAGGSIINVVRYSALMAIKKKQAKIAHKDLLTGIRRELKKQGITL